MIQKQKKLATLVLPVTPGFKTKTTNSICMPGSVQIIQVTTKSHEYQAHSLQINNISLITKNTSKFLNEKPNQSTAAHVATPTRHRSHLAEPQPSFVCRHPGLRLYCTLCHHLGLNNRLYTKMEMQAYEYIEYSASGGKNDM